jgi:hypothetical protein
MSKDELADWDVTAANNTDVGGISIAEGMNAAGVNNAMREIMAQLAAFYASMAWHGSAEDVPSDNLNSITASGIYDYAPTDTNIPDPASGVVLHLARATDRGIQIAARATLSSGPHLFWRELSGDGFSAWQDIMFGEAGSKAIANFNSDNVTISATESGPIDPTAVEYGVTLSDSGQIIASRINNVAARIKRSNDGSVLQWYGGTTLVGAVSIASGVVTYGSFCGTHWSQFKALAKPDVWRGTILETIDSLCEWDDATEDILPQVKVAGRKSPRVYGVFSHWDEDSRDLHVASLGAFTVRIAAGQRVKLGDLIESGGNGCGVAQADDVFRAGTVAKVTGSATKTYPDGSYLVPCTLHCG